MRKEVLVCDFCQKEGTDTIAIACCCICSKMYCELHERIIEVTIGASVLTRLGVRDSFVVCPDCQALFAFDNWTTGDEETRNSRLDRAIIKLILPSAIEAVKEALKDVRETIGPDDVREWLLKRKEVQHAS